MSLLRSSREKPMRRRAYSNADVTLLASRFGCLLSTSETDRHSVALARQPTFVSSREDSSSLTSSVVALPDTASEPAAMRDWCGESISSTTESGFEDSSDTQTSDNRPIKSPLARSRASVREVRYDQSIGSLMRSSGSSTESESSADPAHRVTCSSDCTDDKKAGAATGLQKSASEGALSSQRASIDEAALTKTIAAVSKRMSKSRPAQRPRLWRRKSKLERLLEENDPNFTLIHYCSDLLCRVPPRLFCVPNIAIAPYMRTCLMRAHASSVDANPFRICGCRDVACNHFTPDAVAKFPVIYVLDGAAGLDAARRYRALVAPHARRSDLGAGAWDEYEISPLGNEFNSAKRITFVYLIYGIF